MAKNSDPSKALENHEALSMADQMKAAGVSAKLKTSPRTGAVENPRREFMKNAIASKVKAGWKKGSAAC